MGAVETAVRLFSAMNKEEAIEFLSEAVNFYNDGWGSQLCLMSQEGYAIAGTSPAMAASTGVEKLTFKKRRATIWGKTIDNIDWSKRPNIKERIEGKAYYDRDFRSVTTGSTIIGGVSGTAKRFIGVASDPADEAEFEGKVLKGIRVIAVTEGQEEFWEALEKIEGR